MGASASRGLWRLRVSEVVGLSGASRGSRGASKDFQGASRDFQGGFRWLPEASGGFGLQGSLFAAANVCGAEQHGRLGEVALCGQLRKRAQTLGALNFQGGMLRLGQISNGCGICDPDFEALRFEFMRTDCSDASETSLGLCMRVGAWYEQCLARVSRRLL